MPFFGHTRWRWQDSTSAILVCLVQILPERQSATFASNRCKSGAGRIYTRHTRMALVEFYQRHLVCQKNGMFLPPTESEKKIPAPQPNSLLPTYCQIGLLLHISAQVFGTVLQKKKISTLTTSTTIILTNNEQEQDDIHHHRCLLFSLPVKRSSENTVQVLYRLSDGTYLLAVRQNLTFPKWIRSWARI